MIMISVRINNSEVGFDALSCQRLGSRPEPKNRMVCDIVSAPVATV